MTWRWGRSWRWCGATWRSRRCGSGRGCGWRGGCRSRCRKWRCRRCRCRRWWRTRCGTGSSGRPGGGGIDIAVDVVGDEVVVEVRNALPPGPDDRGGAGHSIGLQATRARVQGRTGGVGGGGGGWVGAGVRGGGGGWGGGGWGGVWGGRGWGGGRGGGGMGMAVEVGGDGVVVEVRDAWPPGPDDRGGAGHSIGLQATRARVQASTGGRGGLESGREGEAFVARMRVPVG